ncbi:uncharacterized protein IWZ02DRAFT_495137 [Phyllosticta citriasiana]|uniref:uncharacterized protein n=1 Tax=Phyllosticta citriasiana TaxID=595635 RepID=UPI0030FD6B88
MVVLEDVKVVASSRIVHRPYTNDLAVQGVSLFINTIYNMASLPARRSSLVKAIGHPPLIYTTSIRTDNEGPCHAHVVQDGLKAGFRAIDASNSKKLPSNEEHVGNGIRDALKTQGLKREQIFVRAPRRSARPKPTTLGSAPLEALESYVPQQIRQLGVRNFGLLKRLGVLHRNARVKPAVAQCALFPKNQWELPLRMFCVRNDVVFQAEGVLAPKNQNLIVSTPVALLSEFAQVSKAGALLALFVAMEVPILSDQGVVDDEASGGGAQGW